MMPNLGTPGSTTPSTPSTANPAGTNPPVAEQQQQQQLPNLNRNQTPNSVFNTPSSNLFAQMLNMMGNNTLVIFANIEPPY